MQKLTEDERKILFEYGYQYSPLALKATSVAERDQAMLYQWQQNFEPELNEVMRMSMVRDVEADGVHGPVTSWSLQRMPRCGCLDYRDPTAAMAEANWPDACRSALTWAHRIPRLSGLSQSEIHEGLRRGFEIWHQALVVNFEERQEDYPKVHFQERSAGLGNGGVLARHLLAHNRCDSSTWGEYNTSISWTMRLFLPVVAHELGHGLGFDHVVGPANLMNPSITRGAQDRGGTPIGPDLAEAKRKGYTLRTTPPPPDPDDPKIPTGKVRGRVMMFLGNQTIIGEDVPFEIKG